MASRQIYSGKNKWVREKQWRARVKQDEVEYYLGHYLTKAEAEKVEAEFRAGK